MSLEGNLRDLALVEVCQLLAHTRKSGELRLIAPLTGLRATISFDGGSIVDASVTGDSAATGTDESTLDSAQRVESATLEVLGWNDGTFQFVPAGKGEAMPQTGVRLNTELILLESTRRKTEWARLSDRIPNVRAIPTFAEVEPRQLPLLNLTPQQWEVLTGVDGVRDLASLAHSLGRDLLEVAEIVHGLLGTGLLRLVETARVARTLATPPSSDVEPDELDADLWVPTDNELLLAQYSDIIGDEIFDPVRVGVITPDGLPRLSTPAISRRTQAASVSATKARQLSAREEGDEAARRGDLRSALQFWYVALDHSRTEDDVVHAREAISVASRLQQLLNINHGG